MKKIGSTAYGLLILFALCFGFDHASAHPRVFSETPAEAIQVKPLPGAHVLESAINMQYFPASALQTFQMLTQYLKQHGLQMAVPVTLSYEQARMRFYIQHPAGSQTLASTSQVSVTKLPERMVVSLGIKGKYNRSNYELGKQKILTWLKEHPEWQSAGPAYIVYWSNPYLPANLKHSEVHLPIQKNTKNFISSN